MRRRTVLVLGAGASRVFGLPLGSELRDSIAKDLNLRFDEFGQRLISGSFEIVEALRIINRREAGGSGNINPHRAAAVEISQAMAFSSSIDEYIERHSDDEKKAACAKLAIAKSILAAERNSNLYWDPSRFEEDSGIPPKATDTWLSHFLRDITRGKTRSDIASAFANLTIVNFNYDRCFEQFAYEWLHAVYRIAREEAADIVASLKVYHPYGRLGPLKWEDPNGIPYGASIDAHRLISIAEKIRTYSEAKEPESGLDRIKTSIEKSSSLVFLGFGFHQQNLDLLTVETKKSSSMWCYATTSGLSQPSWDIYKTRVKKMLGIAPERDLRAAGFDGDCEAFWNEYSTPILV